MLLLWQAVALKGYTRLGKALNELGIEYEAVTGTSIGAINGALMVQGDLQKAKDMWKNLRMDQCVKLPENAALVSDNLMDRQHAGMILKEVITHGGIDQSLLYDLLAQYIDISLIYSSIYSSSVDFGLCTYSLRNRSSLKVGGQIFPSIISSPILWPVPPFRDCGP